MSEENTIIDVNGEIVKVDNDKKFPPIEDVVKCAPPSPFHPEHGPFPYPPIPNHGPVMGVKKGYVQTIYGDEKDIFAERDSDNPSEYYVWHQDYATFVEQNSSPFVVSGIDLDNGHVTGIYYTEMNSLPTPSPEDAGKIASVNEEGEWEFRTLPPSGGAVELHEIISQDLSEGTLDMTLDEINDIIKNQHVIPYLRVGEEVVFISSIFGYDWETYVGLTCPTGGVLVDNEVFETTTDQTLCPFRELYKYYIEVVKDERYGAVPDSALAETKVKAIWQASESETRYSVLMPELGTRKVIAEPSSDYWISKWTIEVPGDTETEIPQSAHSRQQIIGTEGHVEGTIYRVYIAPNSVD